MCWLCTRTVFTMQIKINLATFSKVTLLVRRLRRELLLPKVLTSMSTS